VTNVDAQNDESGQDAEWGAQDEYHDDGVSVITTRSMIYKRRRRRRRLVVVGVVGV